MQLDGGPFAIDDLELGLADGEHRADRHPAALEPGGAHEGAVGRAEIVHLDAVIGDRQLQVVTRDRGVREDDVVVLGLPQGEDLALRLNRRPRVGPLEELDGEGLHLHVRRRSEACGLRHGAGL